MRASRSNSLSQSDSDDAAASDRRRELHLQSEQRRRDSIKLGYDRLYDLVSPDGAASMDGKAPSKAAVLQRCIRYMESLNSRREAQAVELANLRIQVAAMQVMEDSYRLLLAPAVPRVPDAVKLAVFRGVMDDLFDSFQRATADDGGGVGSGVAAEPSESTLAWLDATCGRQAVLDLGDRVVHQVLGGRQLPG